MNVTYEYPDGRLLVYENYPFTPYGLHGFDDGNVFYGTEGYMVFSRRGAFSVFLGPKTKPGPTEGKELRGQTGYPEHMADFLERRPESQPPTRAPPEVGHRSCAWSTWARSPTGREASLISIRDATKFIDCQEADALLTKEYRAGFDLPNV